MTTNRPLRVFLCHSSADKPAVRELYQKLRAEPWIEPWLDEEELYPGDDWDLAMEKAVEESDVVLVCLSNGLDRLRELEPHVAEAGFRADFAAAKRENKVALSNWIGREMGIAVSPDALFDVQIKRIHEYKRQLLNILETIAHWHRVRSNPKGPWVPRVKVFGGKAAPGYAVAKEIIRLINDVAVVVNSDAVTKDLLKIVYPANYNVTMAERVIPASDLSEQISTSGKEASGTGNMKFMMNGAVTIGTLDGANVEILQEVGAENFFLFGLTAEEVAKRREDPDHAKKAIEASQPLLDVLQMIAEGRFSPDEPGRAGVIWANTYNQFDPTSPFGGYGESGYGREGGRHGLLPYLEVQS